MTEERRPYWLPDLSPKQMQVFNDDARALLVSGPRLSGKTRAVAHRVVRHLYETDRARVGMFARTLKSSKDGGSWTLLHRDILQDWFRAKIGTKNNDVFRYTTETNGIPGPKVDGITRTPFFRVRNHHGTESEMLLFSLDNDNDVEAKLKELEFSMIWFSELDKFGDRRVLTVALPSLRMGHLNFKQQSWIADCNPSEEGEQSWIYQLFYKERNMAYEEYVAHQKRQELPALDEPDFRAFHSQLNVIEILPKDNPYIDPRQLQEVRVSCGADQGLFARHVEGKWVWGGGDASRHFRGVFQPALHVVGHTEGPEEQWITAMPSEHCFELTTGWDLGDVNHAWVALEKEIINGLSYFTVVDELESIAKEVSNEEFTLAVMEIIEALEYNAGRLYGRDIEFNLERAWSDRSSLDKYSAAADTYPHLQVNAASGGRINLRGAPKARESVKLRVRILKELLTFQRIKVSAHCKAVLKMLRDLRRGKSILDYTIGPERHIFDALTYALFMELREEYEMKTWTSNSGSRSPLAIQVG